MTNPFVFIAGCPRSGTTLLQRIVNAHPLIAVIPEIGWILNRYQDRRFVTPEDLVLPALLQDLIHKGSLGRYTRLPVSQRELEELLARIRHCPIEYSELITLFFDRYGEARGKALVGNKTVDYVKNFYALHNLWPQAKFIHLIRDGRDVSLSAVNWRRSDRLASQHATWSEEPVSTAALWWEWQVRLGREAGTLLSQELYHEIRYEDLVSDPTGTCQALCDFLDVPYDEAMLRFHEGREREESDLDAKHAWRPPTPGLRNWRTQMSQPDQVRFEAVAGELLEELGYPRGIPELSAEDLHRAFRLRERFEGRPLPQRWLTALPADRFTR
jgi:hypothetical protein